MSDVKSKPSEVLDPAEIELRRKRELLAKIKVIRERINNNRGMVTGDPAKTYIWVNRDEHRRNYFEGLGYVMCREKDITKPVVKSAWMREDGTHVRGDLILYEIDKDVAEALHMEEAMRALEAIEGPPVEFANFAERHGVPVYEPK